MNVKSGQCYITAPFPGLPNAATKNAENIYYEMIYGQGENVKRAGGGHDRAERGPCAGEGAPRVAPGRAGRGSQGGKETCAVRLGTRRAEKGGRCNIILIHPRRGADYEYYVLISPAADVRLRRA